MWATDARPPRVRMWCSRTPAMRSSMALGQVQHPRVELVMGRHLKVAQLLVAISIAEAVEHPMVRSLPPQQKAPGRLPRPQPGIMGSTRLLLGHPLVALQQ